jgi:hypothetical protein
MIFWGFHGSEKVCGSGYFYCPTCELKRHYSLIQIFQAWHICFIKISKKLLDECIECSSCRKRMPTHIVNYNFEKNKEKNLVLFHEIMAIQIKKMSRAASLQKNDAEDYFLSKFKINKLFYNSLDLENDVTTKIYALTYVLPTKSKQEILHVMASVANTDNGIPDDAWLEIFNTAEILELSEDEFKMAIKDSIESA